MIDLLYILQRYSMVEANGGSTMGLVFEKLNDAVMPFSCYSIEDEERTIKVAGETRIPAGRYELKIWNGGKDPNDWVLRHRERYGSWFKFPIQLIDVPGFSGVLIHTGVDQKDTEGCLCFCFTMGNNVVDKERQGARSLEAVKAFYDRVYPHLEQGGRAFIEVRDEQNLL